MGETCEKVYKYMIEYLKENLFPPTMREIGEAVGISSTSTIASHLQTLEELGLIKRAVSGQRAIKINGYKIVPTCE